MRVLAQSGTAVGGWRRHARRGAVKLQMTTRDPLRGAVADEFVAASFLQQVASTSLRWDLLGGVGASGASSFAGGAVCAQVPRKVVEAPYRFGETPGTAPLLPTADFLELLRDAFGHCLRHHRAEAGAMLTRAPWTTLFFFRFKCKDHIKMKELRALIRLVQKVDSWGCQEKSTGRS